MCKVVGGGVVAGQEFQRCVSREKVLQGLEGEGDCVCVHVCGLFSAGNYFVPGFSCNGGGNLKMLFPSIL